jgi:transcriptional regulator with XRE-family HTH domain
MDSRIVKARELSSLSQKELAEKIGISPSTLNGYEKGNHDPKSIGLIKIAQTCNVTTDYLLGLTDVPNRVVTSYDENMLKLDTDDERTMLSKYRLLNDDGKKKLIERADELHSLGYIKEDDARLA